MLDKVVVLDPGHGGRDSGAIGNTTQEKNNNLTLALKVGKILQQHNVTVYYTRTTDKDFCDNEFSVNLDLYNRIILAKGYNPDVFISLHNNSFNQQAKGLETWCYKFGGSDEALAKCIQNNMVNSLGMTNRGVKISGNGLYVLKKFNGTITDAVLVEYGFIDSEEDLILSKMDIASIAISKGILEHLNIQYQEQFSPPSPQPLEGGKKVKAIVTYKYEIDGHGASYLKRFLNAPIIPADELTQNIIDNTEVVYQVGGSLINPKFTLISGNNEYDTLIAVMKFIGKI